jgi:hypothetical protein
MALQRFHNSRCRAFADEVPANRSNIKTESVFWNTKGETLADGHYKPSERCTFLACNQDESTAAQNVQVPYATKNKMCDSFLISITRTRI